MFSYNGCRSQSWSFYSFTLIYLAFKVGLSPSIRDCFICFNESALKTKNAFYLILKWDRETSFPDLFFLLFKASGLRLSFNIFLEPSTWHTIKTNSVKLYTIDPEICSNLSFQKKIWKQFLHHILFVIFREKNFVCCLLLTDRISLFYYLDFLMILTWKNLCFAKIR